MPKKKKYLYLVSQSLQNDYDSFDSFIGCAESEEEVKLITPTNEPLTNKQNWGEWITLKEVEHLKIKLLGVADKGIKKGVVLASFNAG